MFSNPITNTALGDNVVVWQQSAYVPDLGSTRVVIAPQKEVYPWPSAECQPTIVSSSADDAAAGTGARTVTVTYLDDSFAEHTETVTLNGTTAVTLTADDVYRVNDMNVATVGSGGVTAGDISLKNGTDTIGYIAAGNNCYRQGVYTVPAGKRLFLTGFKIGVTHTATNKRSIIGLAKKDGGLFNTAWETALSCAYADERLNFPLIFAAGIDIYFNGISNGTATVHVFSEGWLADD